MIYPCFFYSGNSYNLSNTDVILENSSEGSFQVLRCFGN